MIKQFCLYILLSFGLNVIGTAQNIEKKSKIRYYEIESMTGTIVPNYRAYPTAGVRTGFGFTFGAIDTTSSPLNYYFNFPKKGVYLGIHTLGNDSIYGQEVSLMPVIELKSGKKWSFRLGLGVSYFTKTYLEHPENLMVGSHFTWGFQTFLYRHIPLRNNNQLKLGAAFLHGSNGHTQLPNYGLNSAVISIGFQHLSKPLLLPERNRHKYKGNREWMFTYRVGVGFHEFGNTTKPVGGPKKEVYNTALAVGVLLKKQVKLQAGIGYRYYQHYADYIKTHQELNNEKLDANNVYFTLGSEFFIRHVSMVVEGGINLYKPFYPKFAEEFKTTEGLGYQLEKIFLSRVGLNFYLIDTSKSPKHNVYLGAQLHANFGIADFSGISLGYLVNLSR